MILRKTMIQFSVISKMNKSNSIEAIELFCNLSEQAKLLLHEISKIENYFIEEINQRKISKKLNKHVTGFDYIDQALIALSTRSGGVSIISFKTIVGAPVGIAGASLTLSVSLSTEIFRKLLNITKKKKHDKIPMLAKSKLNSIETLISQELTDMDISHEEFVTIL